MGELGIGLSLGLAAGISPGPLLFLVLTSTLRSGWQAGAATAAAPLATDLVVVTVTVLLLGQLPASRLSLVGLAGGAFVAVLGVRTLRQARQARLVAPSEARSLGRALWHGAVVNLLSPHPWLFWASALGPLTVLTWRRDRLDAVALVAGFYLTLVGSKVLVALAVAAGRSRLSTTGYRRVLAAGGGLMLLAAVGIWVEFAPQVR